MSPLQSDEPLYPSDELSVSGFPCQHVDKMNVVDNRGERGNYVGSWDERNARPHGKGCMEYEKEIYDGDWFDGDWSGYGKLTNKTTGDVFYGGFFDNMKHGLGVLKYADGRTYDGTFVLNHIGKGKMTYHDGSSYWGYWSQEGVPHGRGKFCFPDGRVYDGEFTHGVIEGHGKMTYPDKRWYLGEWIGGEKNGLGMEVMHDGRLLHEGTFCGGKPVMCHSFPERRKSLGSCPLLVYRISVSTDGGSRSKGTLVGPLSRLKILPRTRSWKI